MGLKICTPTFRPEIVETGWEPDIRFFFWRFSIGEYRLWLTVTGVFFADGADGLSRPRRPRRPVCGLSGT